MRRRVPRPPAGHGATMMNRRHAFMGIALAGAAQGNAFAQTGTVRTLSGSEHTAKSLMAGTLAKQTSELALQRAQQQKVKQFASFEIAEQTAMAQVLTDVANPRPVPLDAGHEAVLKSLQSLSGVAFDRAYVQGQIQGHEELLLVQDGYLADNNRSTDGQHIAVLARMVIQQHLTMLRELQQMLAT